MPRSLRVGRPARRRPKMTATDPAVAFVGGRVGAWPDAIFVPGLGAPGYLMPWVRRLAKWTRVTVLDLPGWRWGRARHSPPTLDGVADATVERLRSSRRPVVLVGHSTAAQSAALVAHRAPELLAGLVLAGPTFDPAVRGLGSLSSRVARTLPHESPGEVPAVLPHYLHSGMIPLARLLADGLRRGASVYQPAAVPTLIVTGRHDALAPPSWAAELARRLSAPAVAVPGGHNFCFTHPADAEHVLRSAMAEWALAAASAV